MARSLGQTSPAPTPGSTGELIVFVAPKGDPDGGGPAAPDRLPERRPRRVSATAQTLTRAGGRGPRRAYNPSHDRHRAPSGHAH